MQTTPCTVGIVMPVYEPVALPPAEKKVYTPDEILMDVCLAFGQSVASVLGKGRKGEVVICRKLFFYIAYNKTKESLEKLAIYLGNRDHTTCLYHVHDVIGYLKVKDPSFLLKWEHYLKNSQLFNANDFK